MLCFFNFWTLIMKMYILRLWYFSSPTAYAINLFFYFFFLLVVQICKIHCFVLATITMIRDRLQIPLFCETKGIGFSDNFRGNRSQLICLNQLSIRNKIWRRYPFEKASFSYLHGNHCQGNKFFHHNNSAYQSKLSLKKWSETDRNYSKVILTKVYLLPHCQRPRPQQKSLLLIFDRFLQRGFCLFDMSHFS